MLTHGEQLLAEWKHPDPMTGEQSRRAGAGAASAVEAASRQPVAPAIVSPSSSAAASLCASLTHRALLCWRHSIQPEPTDAGERELASVWLASY
jgi:hypothetical protein